MHSTISTDYVVNARYTVMGITRSTLHAARPRKRQGASLPLAQALPSAGGLRPDERARGRCMIRQAQRGDAAPGRQYQCNTNVCQVFALRPHTNQRIRRDNATLAPVAPACVALRRCLPASLPASLPACVASQATLHQSGRDAAPRDAAPVRASQGGGRRWPSQGKSGQVRATRRQVRASQGNGKANEIRHLRQVRAAVRGWIGCADPPRGSVGGGQDDFDTPTGRCPTNFAHPKNSRRC